MVDPGFYKHEYMLRDDEIKELFYIKDSFSYEGTALLKIAYKLIINGDNPEWQEMWLKTLDFDLNIEHGKIEKIEDEAEIAKMFLEVPDYDSQLFPVAFEDFSNNHIPE